MEAAIHVKPFGFDRVFRFPAGESPAANCADLERQIAALEAEFDRSAKERQSVVERAREEGFAAGLAQARAEREAAMLAAVDALHAALDDVEARLPDMNDATRRDAAEAALAAAEILAGHAVDVAPARAVDEALGRVLEQIGRGAQLHIRAHPELVAEVERLVLVRTGRERRKLSITVLADPALAMGDALIFWDEGGLGVDAAARRSAVLAELGPLLRAGDA